MLFNTFGPVTHKTHVSERYTKLLQQREYRLEWAEKIGLGFELTAGGLNDKDAALAAGYSISVAENTKQRIWKPQVVVEYDRITSRLQVVTDTCPAGRCRRGGTDAEADCCLG